MFNITISITSASAYTPVNGDWRVPEVGEDGEGGSIARVDVDVSIRARHPLQSCGCSAEARREPTIEAAIDAAKKSAVNIAHQLFLHFLGVTLVVANSIRYMELCNVIDCKGSSLGTRIEENHYDLVNSQCCLLCFSSLPILGFFFSILGILLFTAGESDAIQLVHGLTCHTSVKTLRKMESTGGGSSITEKYAKLASKESQRICLISAVRDQ